MASSTFFSGIAHILDFGNTLSSYDPDRSAEEALASDWDRVYDDLSVASFKTGVEIAKVIQTNDTSRAARLTRKIKYLSEFLVRNHFRSRNSRVWLSWHLEILAILAILVPLFDKLAHPGQKTADISFITHSIVIIIILFRCVQALYIDIKKVSLDEYNEVIRDIVLEDEAQQYIKNRPMSNTPVVDSTEESQRAEAQGLSAQHQSLRQ